MKLILIITLFFTSSMALSDPFNRYMWNRTNVISKNGIIDRSPWYEWWYYKVIIPDTGEAFYFVYGVVNPWDTDNEMAGTRAFLEAGDFRHKTLYKSISAVHTFDAAYDKTRVSIGQSSATDTHLSGHLDTAFDRITWDFAIDKRWAFNATSWMTGKQVTNIEWYPAQADARCTGVIERNGETLRFQDAPCYQDRNWGNSFPKWWTWIVSNQFEGHPDTALAIGGGKPKVAGKYEEISGVSIGLRHKGKEYAFQPCDFDVVTIDIHYGRWEVTGMNKNFKVQISAFAPEKDFLDLEFIAPDGSIFHDFETLQGDVTVKLYQRTQSIISPWKLIETLISHNAGIEYGSFDPTDFSRHFSTSRKLQ